MLKVVTDPPSGKVLRLRAGSGLELRFRRGMSRNRWQVAELPGHLVPLCHPDNPDATTTEDNSWALRFLVFRGDERPAPLRLELTRDDLSAPAEVRQLRVLVTG